MYISVYNLFYTSLPVLALGVFEQDVSDEDSIEYPKLYTPGLTSEFFNLKEFMRSVSHGLFSSLVTFIIPWGTYRDGITVNGLVLSDHMTLASVMAAILIFDNTAQVSKTPLIFILCCIQTPFSLYVFLSLFTDRARYYVLDSNQSRDYLGQRNCLFWHRLCLQLLFRRTICWGTHHCHGRWEFLANSNGVCGDPSIANVDITILYV